MSQFADKLPQILPELPRYAQPAGALALAEVEIGPNPNPQAETAQAEIVAPVRNVGFGWGLLQTDYQPHSKDLTVHFASLDKGDELRPPPRVSMPLLNERALRVPLAPQAAIFGEPTEAASVEPSTVRHNEYLLRRGGRRNVISHRRAGRKKDS